MLSKFLDTELQVHMESLGEYEKSFKVTSGEASFSDPLMCSLNFLMKHLFYDIVTFTFSFYGIG